MEVGEERRNTMAMTMTITIDYTDTSKTNNVKVK